MEIVLGFISLAFLLGVAVIWFDPDDDDESWLG